MSHDLYDEFCVRTDFALREVPSPDRDDLAGSCNRRASIGLLFKRSRPFEYPGLYLISGRHIFRRFGKNKYLIHDRWVPLCVLKHVTGNVFGTVFNSPDINIGNTGKRSDEAMSMISN